LTTENTFVCEHCGGVFEKARTDEEAAREYEATFSERERQGEHGVLCDDCWLKFMWWLKRQKRH
jgi:hypothetical protein